MDTAAKRYLAFGLELPFTHPTPFPGSGGEVAERMHLGMKYAGLSIFESEVEVIVPGIQSYKPVHLPRRR